MEDWNNLQEYVRSGSAEALGRIVQRYVNPVYAMCRRQLGDLHLAEDATQAVFLVLAKRAAKIREGTILSGWLFQTARYACSSLRRSEGRRKKYERQASPMNGNPKIFHTERAELERILDDALASLRTWERNLILLRFTEGLKVTEVAMEMGISESTVRKRLSRAIGRLRVYFERHGVVPSEAGLSEYLTSGLIETAPISLVKGVVAISAGSGEVTGAASAAIAKGVMSMIKLHVAKVIVLGVSAVVMSGVVVAFGTAEVLKGTGIVQVSKEVMDLPMPTSDNMATTRPAEVGRLQDPVTLMPPYPKSYPDAPTDKISIQYAAMEMCKQVGLRYNFQDSNRNANPEGRTWIKPRIDKQPFAEALQKMLKPHGLSYELRNNEIVLVRSIPNGK